MRQIFNDFMKLQRRSDGSIRIPLGSDQSEQALIGLADGDHVELIYPENLVAEAIVEHVEHEGRVLWYAVVPNEDAIVDIHPETLAASASTDVEQTSEARA
ncbi:MAG TPA: hypothetical protein VMV29_11160 [Ktedonobacterales bacterium]|nr:hypothetical protein [Ktedonobacterales bacterium]